jgi:hypothetical protein
MLVWLPALLLTAAVLAALVVPVLRRSGRASEPIRQWQR